MSEQTYNLASISGDNTHTLGCKIYGGHRHYGVCLKVIEMTQTGQFRHYDRDCHTEIMNGGHSCPALKMRAEEMEKGVALYYKPRSAIGLPELPKNVTPIDPNYERGYRLGQPRGAVKSSSLVTQASPPREAHGKKVISTQPARINPGSMHADLVNQMMKEESRKAST